MANSLRLHVRLRPTRARRHLACNSNPHAKFLSWNQPKPEAPAEDPVDTAEDADGTKGKQKKRTTQSVRPQPLPLVAGAETRLDAAARRRARRTSGESAITGSEELSRQTSLTLDPESYDPRHDELVVFSLVGERWRLLLRREGLIGLLGGCADCSGRRMRICGHGLPERGSVQAPRFCCGRDHLRHDLCVQRRPMSSSMTGSVMWFSATGRRGTRSHHRKPHCRVWHRSPSNAELRARDDRGRNVVCAKRRYARPCSQMRGLRSARCNPQSPSSSLSTARLSRSRRFSPATTQMCRRSDRHLFRTCENTTSCAHRPALPIFHP